MSQHNGLGARRIISAASSRKSGDVQPGTPRSRQGKQTLEEQKQPGEGDFLPEIPGQSARSRQSLMSPSQGSSKRTGGMRGASAARRGEGERKAAATPQGSAGVRKSFQLADQFGPHVADQIIGQASQGSRLGEKKDALTVNKEASAGTAIPPITKPNDAEAPSQKIDFHGVNGAGTRTAQGGNTARSRPGSARASGRGGSAIQAKKPAAKKVSAWESFEVNQFKVRNQQPGQIIDKLKQLTANDIPFMGELPPPEGMDSTDPLDSLMEAFVKITTDKATDFTDEVKKGIHLATGTRTEFCEALLTFICHHQKLEQAFRDSVDFFMESLTSVVKLEEENRSMKLDISHLLNLKEDGILVKFNLEKRLKDQMGKVDQVSQKEQQAQAKIKALLKQLSDKSAECESLQYRLQHFEEINSMMDPPTQNVVSAGAVPGGGGPTPAPHEEQASRGEHTLAHAGSTASAIEHPKIRDLQNSNKRLEEELQQMREAFAQKDNSEHFRKIQELFNKIQIENKNLRIYNQKCESKLESKQNLINHLEGKVTSVMVEKEEVIIKLKSEIVLLKNKLELDEEKFQSKLEMQQKKLEYEFKNKYSETIKDLDGTVADLDKQKKDLRKRLTRLHKEHEELSLEFTRFRREKEEQEAFRNKQFKSLEDKISSLQAVDDEKISQLNKQIEELENQNEVVKKENNILMLRQKYLKQQTETLAKQKVFLFETLHKGKGEIEESLTKMENAMRAEQPEAYLVSVEQCIKRARGMADMGTAALQNISQILQFLKIEKLHQLLSDEDELEQLEKGVIQSMQEDQEEQRALFEQPLQKTSNQRSPGTTKGEADTSPYGQGGLAVQRFLNKHGMGDQASQSPSMGPSPVPARSQSKTHGPVAFGSQQVPASGDKNEDYYLNNCPVELASICVKLLVDVLIRVGKCKSIADVPAQVNLLLQQCNRKSDQTVEKEILNKYLSGTKQLIDQQISDLQSMPPAGVEVPMISEDQKQQISEQILNPSNVVLPVVKDLEPPAKPTKDLPAAGSRANAEEGEGSAPDSAPEAQKSVQAQVQADQLRLDLQRVTNKLEEQKMKSRHLQLNLAGKIVVLEEQIEHMNQERGEHIAQLEKTHQEELQRITAGVEQREAQLLQLCDEYRDEVRDLQFKLESSWKPAEESKAVQKMEKGTKGNLYKLMKEEYERRFQKNSELLENYRASIDEFVYLREDLRGSFTLAFECERLGDGLRNMLNESMLKYYLSKTFVLDKSKFRFLRSEQLFERAPGTGSKSTKILKIIVEVVAEDQARVGQLFKNVKAQIKDGTSLLYDFMPLYFGMNLGSSGFSTHHNLKEFGLLSKTGQIIDGEDYVVSVMRNKEKPLIFKIIAFNLGLREEFMMELSESDIYELVEGDQQLLKNLEPDALVKKITTNLNLIVRDKIKVLTCEQKIFFNELWMKNMESGKNQQIHTRTPEEGNAVVTGQHPLIKGATGDNPGNNLMQSSLTHTAARTSQLSRLWPKNPVAPKEHLEKFNKSVHVQTNFESSTLYEGLKDVYRGVQKVGEIAHMRLTIQESTTTSTLVFTFDDLTSLKKLKFSLYEKAADDQYVIHSECMVIADGHHVLVTVEYIQQQGLLIRMHDMLECRSVSRSLVRKQNGDFASLPEDGALDLLMKEDFRHFIYEVTFVINKEETENVMRNMQYLFREDQQMPRKSSRAMIEDFEQQKQIEALKRESTFKTQATGKILPRRKRAQQAMRVYSFSLKAYYKDKWDYLTGEGPRQFGAGDPASSTPRMPRAPSAHTESSPWGADWRDVPGEKGTLLYRQVFPVRCIFDGAEETPLPSVITLYLKEQSVNIEVSLYNNDSKMSIASSVHALELFRENPLQIPFKERITLLNSMMEKFFIISEDSVYHMKVESDAVPIDVFCEAREREAALKNPKENKAQDYDLILTTQIIREIQDEKDQFLTSGRATRYSRFTDIDGEVHEVEMLFMAKKKGKTEKSGGRHAHHKRASTYGKSPAEIAQIQIEQFLDEACDWDQIYFEIVDQSKEMVAALYDKKKLSQMLSKDEFFDWKSAMSNVDPLLLDYIKKSIKVDKGKGEVTLHNRENVEHNVYEKYRKAIGGRYLMRADLDLSADEQKIIKKQMISNTEIEMSEFLYDVKIYQVFKIVDRCIIAYQIEIFTLYDPDVVYLYNYPMNFTPDTQDPHTLVIDVVNLIEHPRGEKPGEEKKGKPHRLGTQSTAEAKASEKTSGAVSPKDGGLSGSAGPGSPSSDAGGQQRPSAGQTPQQQVHNSKAAFRRLFRKYIDNRVLLFIQETRFPRKLDFVLVEPCSQLLWRHHIEPMQITTGLASMHLVDQATLEMVVSVLLDENENCQPSDAKLYEYQGSGKGETQALETVQVSENWANIREVKDMKEAAVFVSGHEIQDCDLTLSITKKRDAFNIQVRSTSPCSESQAENFGSTTSDPNEESQGLEFRMNPDGGDTQLCKVLRQRGLTYSVLLVKTQGLVTTIKVLQLSPTSIRAVFKFVFEDCPEIAEKPGEQQDEDYQRPVTSQIFTSKDLQASTVDVLRRYYTAQTIEQAMQMCDNQRTLIEIDNDLEYDEPTIFEKVDEKQPSVHGARMHEKYLQSLETRTMVLHRRSFFDDSCEKLILVNMCLEYIQKDYQDRQFADDVQVFHIMLKEPDIGIESQYLTSITQCLTPEEHSYEIMNGGLKEMRRLRQLAKKILEERIAISRIADRASPSIQIDDQTNQDIANQEMTIMSLESQAQQQMMGDNNYMHHQDMSGEQIQTNEFNQYMQQQNIEEGQDINSYNQRGQYQENQSTIIEAASVDEDVDHASGAGEDPLDNMR